MVFSGARVRAPRCPQHHCLLWPREHNDLSCAMCSNNGCDKSSRKLRHSSTTNRRTIQEGKIRSGTTSSRGVPRGDRTTNLFLRSWSTNGSTPIAAAKNASTLVPMLLNISFGEGVGTMPICHILPEFGSSRKFDLLLWMLIKCSPLLSPICNNSGDNVITQTLLG